jgi:hypothetical protein
MRNGFIHWQWNCRALMPASLLENFDLAVTVYLNFEAGRGGLIQRLG